jgi:hypothetical protein
VNGALCLKPLTFFLSAPGFTCFYTDPTGNR